MERETLDGGWRGEGGREEGREGEKVGSVKKGRKGEGKEEVREKRGW